MAVTILEVQGMSCRHCQQAVTRALAAVPGVETVAVDLETGRVTIHGQVDLAQARRAVEAAGYRVAG